MSQAPRPQRAAALVRISDDPKDERVGVDRQGRDCRELADRLGWQIAEVFTENDTSAFKTKRVNLPDGRYENRTVRPEWRRLLMAIQVGAVDGLIVYDLDRVARDLRDLSDLADLVEDLQLPVESVTGSLRLKTDADIMAAQMGVVMANQSSRATRRRVVRALADRAEKGLPTGGVRRFGFDPDGITHRPEEVEWVQYAAKQVLAGTSASALARDLNEQGVKPVKAQRWSSRTVIDVLTRPRTAGLRVHRGEIVGDAVWEPMLDRDTWNEVRAVLASRSRGMGKPTLTRWLNQLLVCGRCEQVGTLRGWHGPKAGHHVYWCATGDRYRGCGKITIGAEHAEAEVTRQVLGYLTDPDVLQRLATTARGADAERWRTDLAADEEQLKELAQMYGQNRITLAEWVAARGPIEKRIADAKKVLGVMVPARVRQVLEAPDVQAAWESADPELKREVCRTLVRGWRVLPHDRSKGTGRFQPERLVALPHEGADSLPA